MTQPSLSRLQQRFRDALLTTNPELTPARLAVLCGGLFILFFATCLLILSI